MLHLKVTLDQIQYEQTLSALFPALTEKLSRDQQPTLPVLLVQKLGSRSEKAALSILARLDAQSKNDLLLHVFQSLRPQLEAKLKKLLSKGGYGIDFADLSVTQGEQGQFLCCFHQVSIDYQTLSERLPELAHQRRGMGLAAAATGLLGSLGMGDSAVAALLKTEAARRTVANTLEQALRKNGVMVDVTDCEVFRTDTEIAAMPVPETLVLPPEVMESLADAIAGYVGELIDQSEA